MATPETGWQPPYIDDHLSVGLADEAPRDGGAADAEGWAGAQLDPVVIEEGNQLGASIDIDDDADNGGLALTENPVPVGEPGPESPDMDPSVPTPDEPPVTDPVGAGDELGPEDDGRGLE